MVSTTTQENFENARSSGWDIAGMLLGGGGIAYSALSLNSYLKEDKKKAPGLDVNERESTAKRIASENSAHRPPYAPVNPYTEVLTSLKQKLLPNTNRSPLGQQLSRDVLGITDVLANTNQRGGRTLYQSARVGIHPAGIVTKGIKSNDFYRTENYGLPNSSGGIDILSESISIKGKSKLSLPVTGGKTIHKYLREQAGIIGLSTSSVEYTKALSSLHSPSHPLMKAIKVTNMDGMVYVAPAIIGNLGKSIKGKHKFGGTKVHSLDSVINTLLGSLDRKAAQDYITTTQKSASGSKWIKTTSTEGLLEAIANLKHNLARPGQMSGVTPDQFTAVDLEQYLAKEQPQLYEYAVNTNLISPKTNLAGSGKELGLAGHDNYRRLKSSKNHLLNAARQTARVRELENLGVNMTAHKTESIAGFIYSAIKPTSFANLYSHEKGRRLNEPFHAQPLMGPYREATSRLQKRGYGIISGSTSSSPVTQLANLLTSGNRNSSGSMKGLADTSFSSLGFVEMDIMPGRGYNTGDGFRTFTKAQSDFHYKATEHLRNDLIEFGHDGNLEIEKLRGANQVLSDDMQSLIQKKRDLLGRAKPLSDSYKADLGFEYLPNIKAALKTLKKEITSRQSIERDLRVEAVESEDIVSSIRNQIKQLDGKSNPDKLEYLKHAKKQARLKTDRLWTLYNSRYGIKPERYKWEKPLNARIKAGKYKLDSPEYLADKKIYYDKYLYGVPPKPGNEEFQIASLIEEQRYLSKTKSGMYNNDKSAREILRNPSLITSDTDPRVSEASLLFKDVRDTDIEIGKIKSKRSVNNKAMKALRGIKKDYSRATSTLTPKQLKVYADNVGGTLGVDAFYQVFGGRSDNYSNVQEDILSSIKRDGKRLGTMEVDRYDRLFTTSSPEEILEMFLNGKFNHIQGMKVRIGRGSPLIQRIVGGKEQTYSSPVSGFITGVNNSVDGKGRAQLVFNTESNMDFMEGSLPGGSGNLHFSITGRVKDYGLPNKSGLMHSARAHIGSIREGSTFAANNINTFLSTPHLLNITGGMQASEAHLFQDFRARAVVLAKALEDNGIDLGIDRKNINKFISREGSVPSLVLGSPLEEVLKAKIEAKEIKPNALDNVYEILRKNQERMLGFKNQQNKWYGIKDKNPEFLSELRKKLAIHTNGSLFRGDDIITIMDDNNNPLHHGIYSMYEYYTKTTRDAHKMGKAGMFGAGAKYGKTQAEIIMKYAPKDIAGKMLSEHMAIVHTGISKTSWVGARHKFLYSGVESLEGGVLNHIRNSTGLNIGDLAEFNSDSGGMDALRGFLNKNKALSTADQLQAHSSVLNLFKEGTMNNKGYMLNIAEATGIEDLKLSGVSEGVERKLENVLILPLGGYQETGVTKDGKELLGAFNRAQLDLAQGLDHVKENGLTKESAEELLQGKLNSVNNLFNELMHNKGGVMNAFDSGTKYGLSGQQHLKSNIPILKAIRDKSNKNLYVMQGGEKKYIENGFTDFTSESSLGGKNNMLSGGYLTDVYMDDINNPTKQIRVGSSKFVGSVENPKIDMSTRFATRMVAFDSEGAQALGISDVLQTKGSTVFSDIQKVIQARRDFDYDMFQTMGYEFHKDIGEALPDELSLLERIHDTDAAGVQAKIASGDITQVLDIKRTGEFDSYLQAMAEDKGLVRLHKKTQGYLDSLIDPKDVSLFNEKLNIHSLNNVSPIEQLNMVQAKSVQKTMTGIISTSAKAYKGNIQRIFENAPGGIEDFMTDMSSGEISAIRSMMGSSDGKGAEYIVNAVSDGFSGMMEQLSINKGYSNLGLLEILMATKKPSEKMAAIQAAFFEASVFYKSGLGDKNSAFIKERAAIVQQGVFDNMASSLSSMGMEGDKIIAEINQKKSDVKDLLDSFTKVLNKTVTPGRIQLDGVSNKEDFTTGLSKMFRNIMNKSDSQESDTYSNLFNNIKSKMDTSTPPSAMIAALQKSGTAVLNKIEQLTMGLFGFDMESPAVSVNPNTKAAQMTQNQAAARGEKVLADGIQSSEGIFGDFVDKASDYVGSMPGYFSPDKGVQNELTEKLSGTLEAGYRMFSNETKGTRVAKGTGILGLSLAGMWGAATIAGSLSGEDFGGLEEAPLPPRTNLDDPQPMTSYDVAPGPPTVRTASEMSSLNYGDTTYNGENSASFLQSLAGSDTSSYVVQDDTSSFNRTSMNDYKMSQSRSRF